MSFRVQPGARAGLELYMRARRCRPCTHARARETRSKTHHGPPAVPPDRPWCVLFRVSLAHVAMYHRCRGLRGRATDRKSVILVVPGGKGFSPILAISGVQTLAPCELSPYGPLLDKKYFLPERRCRREDRAQKYVRKNFFLKGAAFRGYSQLTRGRPPAAKFGTQKLQNTHFWEQFGRVLTLPAHVLYIRGARTTVVPTERTAKNVKVAPEAPALFRGKFGPSCKCPAVGGGP